MSLNIHQKLIEVRKSCPFLKKDNQGHQFKYVSSSQTLGSLREAMDEQGLLLVPSVISHETRDHTTANGKHSYFSILTMEFVWVNAEKPEETITCSWVGYGLDDAEKGVGKALTYAEKFFMLKFFNIATDKDDPDAFQKKHTPSEPKQAPKTQPLTDQQEKDVILFKEQIDASKGLDEAKKWWLDNSALVKKTCGEDAAKIVYNYVATVVEVFSKT